MKKMASEIFQVKRFAVATTRQVERKGQLSTSVSFPDRSKIITDGRTKGAFQSTARVSMRQPSALLNPLTQKFLAWS